jgi:hypothetical protein
MPGRQILISLREPSNIQEPASHRRVSGAERIELLSLRPAEYSRTPTFRYKVGATPQLFLKAWALRQKRTVGGAIGRTRQNRQDRPIGSGYHRIIPTEVFGSLTAVRLARSARICS